MKVFNLISLILLCVITVSCGSLKGSSSFDDSDSPYVKEEPKEETKEESKPKVKEQPAPKKIVVKEEKVKVIDQANKEVFKYYVIIGSFRVLDNAKNYKKQLIDEGFTPVLLENENGLYRVSIAAYNTEMPARDKIENIRTRYEKYSDVWLLIRKA